MLLAVAALAMTACSKSETEGVAPAAQTKAIGFDSHVNKSSRALSNASLTKFYVSGAYTTPTNSTPVQIFNNEEISKSGDLWSYTTEPRYWIKDANYVFHAYSDNNLKSEKARTQGDAFTLTDYLVNAMLQKDLVYAYKTQQGKETGNAKVAFDFKHVLTKVRFNFISAFPEGYKISIDEAILFNFRDKGTFTGGENCGWNETADRTADDVTIPVAVTATDLEKDATAVTSEYYMIPFAYTAQNVRFRFRLTVKNELGEQVYQNYRTASFKPTWIMGNAYQYNVTLTGNAAGLQKIEFETDPNMNLDDWTTGTGDIEFSFGTDVPGN